MLETPSADVETLALLTRSQTALRLAVSERTLRRYVEQGALRRVLIKPNVVRFRTDDVAALIEASTHNDHRPAANGPMGVQLKGSHGAQDVLET